MTAKIFRIVFVLACLLGYSSSRAEFRDISIDLSGVGVLTQEEVDGKSSVSFGLVFAADGSWSRVAADDPDANITVKGQYNNDHGLVGNPTFVFAVDGPVKIGLGTCQYGTGDASAVNQAGETVVTMNSNDGKCWKPNVDNRVYAYYKGGADVLTLVCKNYTPYISVESVDQSEITEDAYVTFSLEGLTDAGVAPGKVKCDLGKTVTIPANFTVYQEGKTLTGWSDGTNTYKVGDQVTVNADMTLTPVFENNTVTLADRTAPVTVQWVFRQDQGCPGLCWEGKTGFMVAQATVEGKVIDVRLDVDATSGKFNPASNSDWAQTNTGTKFSIPACKGATISYESYTNALDCTIDGQDVKGTSPSFTTASDATPVEMVVTKGTYLRYIQVVLPVAEAAGGVVYDNAAASVIWPFNNPSTADTYTTDPSAGFTMVSFNANGASFQGTGSIEGSVDHYEKNENGEDVVFIKVRPAKAASDVLTWSVTPAKGLTFTPTKVSGWIQRFGTDAENGVSVTASTESAKNVALGTFTALRNNKNKNKVTSNDKDYDKNGTNKFEIELTAEQQSQLTTSGQFSLSASIGVGNTKEGGFSDIRIYGVLNGTSETVAKHIIIAKSNIEDAGEISVYPKADEYDEGTEVKLTAVPNFGYNFVNWTDADGKELSAKAEFNYTVNADAELIANFKAVNTYELAYTIEGGANDYQVQLTPAPTVVDGKQMYEEGTKVTLTASSNEVIKFASWGDGQSSSEISVTMDADHTDIVANFDALDYIVAWDFYKKGPNGRVADFVSADNDAVALVLRNAAGESSSWLDKSQVEAGGYEGRPAAVNWRTTGLGDYYWQTRVNASAFTDIKIITAMLYNYNAYSKQNVEYSLDGENWTNVGTITLAGSKKWTDATFSLPAEADNQSELYIRFISDKTSDVVGNPSDNDGIALGATYITGSPKLIDDGTAPVLVAQVPEEGSESASINGRVVLTFDEKVKVKDGAAATLGDITLTPNVTGKTVMFEYKNLSYATSYRFTLPAGSIMDLTDNAIDKEIVINFTTKTRPEVEKGTYDAIVTNVDELVAAIAQAEKRDDTSKRFRIFIHDGFYQIPASETATKSGDADKGDGNSVYPDPTTYINTPNISFIGESRDGVVVTNTPGNKLITTKYGDQHVLEGIGRGDVLNLNKNATGTYFQNLTLKSAMGDSRGRDIVLNDKSNKTIFKDACLWAYQDTYVSNNENSRFYFEGGYLRGRTDFLCGKGDVFYNGVLLEMCEKGGYLTAPSKPLKYGYVFKDCEIVGGKSDVDGNYTLGRPWGEGTPSVVYIDTKMTAKPSAAGWNEMSEKNWPKRMAEYNSMTASGTVIDLKDRKKAFANNTHTNNPVLTKAEADEYSYGNVMGGDDDWDPAADAEQAPAPTNVAIDGVTLTWDDSKYAFLWAVCKDGKVIAFTTEPTYTVEPETGAKAAPVYSVRAANEMGGLGEAVNADNKSAISDVNADSEIVSTVYYNLQGIRVNAGTPGVLVKVDTLASGETVTTKVVVK